MLITYILLAVALYNLSLVYVIFRQTTPRQPGRNIAWYLFWFACWIITGATLLTPTISRTAALWVTRMAFFCDTCCGICWLWFVTGFPYPAQRFRTAANVLMAMGVPWLGICWTPWIVQDLRQSPWWCNVLLGPYGWGFAFWLFTSLLTGFIHLLSKSRNSKGIERLQAQYILVGVMVSYAIAFVCNLLLPLLLHSSEYVHFGLLATIIQATMISYAIIRHRLMGLTVVIRQGVKYSLCVVMVLGCFAGLSLAQHVSLPMGSLAASNEQNFAFLLMICMALAFYPLWLAAQYCVDRYLFKSVASYQHTIQYCSKYFATLREPTELMSLFGEAIRNTLAPEYIIVYLPRQENIFCPTVLRGKPEAHPQQLTRDDAIISYAMEIDDVLLTDEYLHHSQADYGIGVVLQGWGVKAAAPFIAGNRLCGVALLGEKRFGDPYTIEDVDLLRILGKSVSVALNTAFHYEALRTLNTELEQRVEDRTEALVAVNASLDAERAYLATAIDMLPIPIYFAAPGTPYPCVERYNKALRELLGDIHGDLRSQMTLLTPDTHVPLRDCDWPDQRTFNGEQVVFQEYLLMNDNGEQIPVVGYAAPIFVEERIVAAVVALHDVRQLKAADRAKDNFLAMISHEILTPLTSILGWGQVGLNHGDPAIVRQAFEVILRNAQRQRRLLDDLLDLTRIQHDKLHLQRAPIDLCELAGQIIDQLHPLADSRKIVLRYTPAIERLVINADPDRMSQVMVNLLNNAIKFTDVGGRVTLDCKRQGEYAILMVRDTGCGIPNKAIPTLFRPFHQVKNSEKSAGIGLGLSLVKGIVELHGGCVTVESPGEEQGSTFTVTMPLCTGDMLQAV